MWVFRDLGSNPDVGTWTELKKIKMSHLLSVCSNNDFFVMYTLFDLKDSFKRKDSKK